MFEFDPKSVVLGIVLTAVVGGGLYGFYFKTGTQTSVTQAQAYSLLGEYSSLMNSFDAGEIQGFLSRANEHLPAINKADAVVTSVKAVSADYDGDAAGMGEPLKMCLESLEEQLVRLGGR